MKSGSSNGSTKSSASKPKDNPSLEVWEENILETLNSKSRDYELVGEVKYRDKSKFPNPFSVLEGRDIAFYKRRRGTPQTLVIMDGDTFQQLMENNNGISTKTIERNIK